MDLAEFAKLRHISSVRALSLRVVHVVESRDWRCSAQYALSRGALSSQFWSHVHLEGRVVAFRAGAETKSMAMQARLGKGSSRRHEFWLKSKVKIGKVLLCISIANDRIYGDNLTTWEMHREEYSSWYFHKVNVVELKNQMVEQVILQCKVYCKVFDKLKKIIVGYKHTLQKSYVCI